MEFFVPHLLYGLRNKCVGGRDVDGSLMIFTYPILGKLKLQSQIYILCVFVIHRYNKEESEILLHTKVK